MAQQKIEPLLPPTTDIIIMGDFNFPIMTWPAGTIEGGSQEDQEQAKILRDLMEQLFLSQEIHTPTRGSNVLDLLLTNNPEIIHGCRTEKTKLSDHNLITVTLAKSKKAKQSQEHNKEKSGFKTLNFNSEEAKWEELKHALMQTDWDGSQHVKCLGINLDADGTFQHHIEETTKAKRIAGWILRKFYSRDGECLMTLWRALVQPILDYCSQLWSPYKAMDIQALESVQRLYTRQIRGMKEFSYWERLRRLGLYSQQRQRERYSRTFQTPTKWRHTPTRGQDENALGEPHLPRHHQG